MIRARKTYLDDTLHHLQSMFPNPLILDPPCPRNSITRMCRQDIIPVLAPRRVTRQGRNLW